MRKIISLAAIAAIVGTVTFWTITHVKSNAAHVQARGVAGLAPRDYGQAGQ